jgi:hypothetical protein
MVNKGLLFIYLKGETFTGRKDTDKTIELITQGKRGGGR